VSALRDALRRLSHRESEFEIGIAEGASLKFRVLRSHSDFLAHDRARQEYVERVCKEKRWAPAEERFMPLDPATALGAYNLHATCLSEGVTHVDFLELAVGNGAAFEGICDQWAAAQANAFARAEEEVIDEAGKDSPVDVSDSSTSPPASGDATPTN
jgi:hypothetical protein